MIARTVRQIASLGLVAIGWSVLSAHVGTQQVVIEGTAGGYPVRVMITPPGVVPAQVAILVRVLDGTPTRVSVRAAQWNVGLKGAPPAEDAALVPGDPGVWSHDLWIMTSSTYAVYVAVEGPAGSGSLVVPLQSTATRTLGMTGGMRALLLVLGALLVTGVLTIVGSAIREGSLARGVEPSIARRRAARIAMASTAGVLALALFGGSKWWHAEEADYRRRLYRPIAIETTVTTIDAARILTIAVTDSLWRTNRFAPLMPDHGKLMHLFLIRADDNNAMAHLHPLRILADTFVTRVPALPPGKYLLFGDVLFQSGTQRTLVDTIDLPVAPVVADELRIAVSGPGISNVVPAFDVDDAWRVVHASPLGAASMLASGGSMTLAADASVVVGRDLRLVATLHDASGTASMLEPYMGMGGHAMVLRRDGGVFMHLHPMGSASMTAQSQLMRRERGDTAMLDSAAIARATSAADAASPMGASHATRMDIASTVSFPFAFPTDGAYRVFVQVKRGGVIETAAFDVTVGAPYASGVSTSASTAPAVARPPAPRP